MWTFEERNDAETLLSFVLRHLERDGPAWMREVLATQGSQAPEALEALQERIVELRVKGLHFADRYRPPRDPKLENLLPIERVIGHFGVRPDGQMFGERLELVERHPMAMLGLDRAWFARSGLDRLTPIRGALHWASNHPQSPQLPAFKAALEVFRREERWLLTFDNEDLDHPFVRERIDYDTLLHGFEHLFDPALLQTPLLELPMKSAPLKRLQKALTKASWCQDKDPSVLAALPPRGAMVSGLPRIGAATVDTLKIALLRHAQRWRTHLHNADRARPAPRTMAPRAGADLKEGLDALAALFGDAPKGS